MRRNLWSYFRRNLLNNRLLWLFALEGAMLQYSGSINGFANNLFATNLGATDVQISLIQTIPNLVAVGAMLPLAVVADKAKTSRTVPLVLLLAITVGYLILGCVPQLGGVRIPVFFMALPFTVGGPTLYGVHWQSLFDDVTAKNEQYKVLGTRNRFMFLISVVAPLACGVLMGRQTDMNGKLRVMQIFYYSCALVALLQAYTISRIPAAERNMEGVEHFSIREFGRTIKILLHNRTFMMFYIPAIILYISWQLDWSMFYIEQIKYLRMTETQLSIHNAVFNIGQLITIGVLSKLSHRRSPDYVFVLGIAGLLVCPAIMAGCMVLQGPERIPIFILAMTILACTQGGVNFSAILIVLRVAPKGRRTMAMSMYTLTTTLTNIFVPYLGVRFYELCGSDYTAAQLFNLLSFSLRLIALIVVAWRYRYLLKKGEIVDGQMA